MAGYPSFEASLAVGRALIAGGAFALEMQIPFSDPSADGPVIEEACRAALAGGFCAGDAFTLLKMLRNESDIPIFVMSYASLVVRPGVKNFVQQAQRAGASGLIIPDLVPGMDEGLYQTAADEGCPAVPVLVPWITPERLNAVLAEPIEWVYAALRSGITGSHTEIGTEQIDFLNRLKAARSDKDGLRIMAGFGIHSSEQVRAVCAHADAAIVGSALVRVIAAAGAGGASKAAKMLLRELLD
ncbi:MAG: tryptophan synthase subunit alpha [Spirochaeta sp. LUC14_002_19_P3]|nr:MAG: tryptophan synthase subunit alpha [Spirochaeta sp. LUC14_002_19_P3]